MSNQAIETAADWFLRLREDTLSDAEMTQWIEWCEAHPENLSRFEELQSLWRAAGEHLPSPEVLSHLLRSDAAPAAAITASRWRPRWALAASILLTVVAGLAFLNHAPDPTAAQSVTLGKIAEVDVLRTPVAQNRTGLLPDGSHVDLGARSVLDVDFSATRRQLKLNDGQAFFQVRRDKNRPFIVSVADIQVIAIGTAFDVRRTENQIDVTVQEGAVKVIKASGDSLTATAGYQLAFNSATGKVSKSLADPGMATAWRSGRLEFTGDPFEVVIASINRYSQHPVVLSDPTLGQLMFTGTVFTQSIDASLDAMEQVFPIEVHRGASQITLVRRR